MPRTQQCYQEELACSCCETANLLLTCLNRLTSPVTMSFKRDGDDKSQLNILKKRRVADLLSNFIPEDEAALMKNGRYTCLVCSYRPVFDTVDMLAVHRKGKRHLEESQTPDRPGLKAFYGKKAQLRNEITKRRHENYVEAEDSRQEPSSSAPLLTQTRKLTHHALLKTVPYNSCHRRTSTKSEKGAGSTSSDPSGNSCNKMPSAYWKTELSHNLSSSISTNEELHPLKDTTGSQAAVTQKEEPMTADRKRELEHYLKLKSDGWLQDPSGQWIKDENVEFDSDEEEPVSLAAPPTNR
ncbi:sodium channel modifier 1 isoform X2 [Acanthochromis polyacanthus]|uniref:Sodium channel modifier 1 n=1 Tax=Acanthochromis polyacanthus TaxID=80966 RepID=A0A3Q1FGF5_9TELE|nr:sodium channel modifier 1 isoform X2 [Acanthochromis polyacanthus]